MSPRASAVAVCVLACLLSTQVGPGTEASGVGPRFASMGWTVDGAGARFGAVRIGLVAVGRAGAPAAPTVGRGRVERRAGEVRIHHAPGVVEWWRSLSSGLEQGVTLDVRPSGEGELVLSMSVGDGVVPRLDGHDIVLADASGAPLASYSHLAVIDADGARVPARLEVEGGHIAIRVDDRAARYPLVVDPFVVALEGSLAPPSGARPESFSFAVSLSADGDRVLASVPDFSSARGRADVFVRSGASWTEESLFSASDGAANHQFGRAVALSADGTRAVVGAPWLVGGSGRAYVYVRSGSVWSQEAILTPNTTLDGMPVVTIAPERFGASVAITRDGSRVVVGAPGTDLGRGSVHIYGRSGTTWSPEATRAAFNRGANDGYGQAVALSGDGLLALVGAPDDDLTLADRGSIDVYAFDGTDWGRVLSEWSPPGAGAGARVGRAVAISRDGTRVLLGASADSYLVTLSADGSSASVETALSAVAGVAVAGAAVALSQDGSVAAASSPGGARVFVRDPTWTLAATLAAPGGEAGFGASLALSGDGARLAVGAPSASATSRVFLYGIGALGVPCAATAECRSGFCVDGVCCDTACGGGSPTDCVACSGALTGGVSGTCAALSASAAPSVTCRPEAGDCDLAETCSPGSTVCPIDRFAAAVTTCRSVAGDCDVEERCTGTSAACPSDGFRPEGTECRAAAPECDVAEACTGTSAACPPDAFEPVETPCGPAPSGVCDAPDHCAGTSARCVETFLSAVECRASSGGCDPPELCNGTIATCPPDLFSPAGTVCRAASDVSCDPVESCDGTTAACPADESRCAGDAGPADASVDAGGPSPTAGCSCRASRGRGPRLALLALLLLALVRRARSVAS